MQLQNTTISPENIYNLKKKLRGINKLHEEAMKTLSTYMCVYQWNV